MKQIVLQEQYEKEQEREEPREMILNDITIIWSYHPMHD